MKINVKTKIIEYEGEKIIHTAGLFWFNGLMFKTLPKAKTAIDNANKQKKLGLN